jgi:ABC-2 type transport system permease protein
VSEMNPLSEARPESPTRPLYWSVRRELWENRSIYIAPVAVASLIVFGFMVSRIGMPHRMRALAALDPSRQRAAVAMPYNMLAGLVLLTAFLVGVFYCLDALYGERRDRSILFWKSLPVSDRSTVLAKAVIPLAVLPLLVIAVIVTAQVVMLLLSSVVLMGKPSSLALLWARLALFQMSLAELYAVIAIALWHAPLYAWLLLVSGWAKRAAFLWAVLPVLALAAFEKIVFDTTYLGVLLRYRLIGWLEEAFIHGRKGTFPADPLTTLTPGNFLTTPGLWLGLAFAAACLAAAVRLRRNREPI